MQVHSVFHVSLLELYHFSTIPDRTRPPPPPIVIESESEYKVEEILDSKYRHKHLFYHIKWKGYNACNNSWDPRHSLKMYLISSKHSMRNIHVVLSPRSPHNVLVAIVTVVNSCLHLSSSVFVYVSSVILSSCTFVSFPFQLGDFTL